MLSPRYLDGVSDEIADIYAQLETDILSDMARRIARLGRITESTKWQAALLKEQGALHKDINRIIKGYAKPIQDEITAAYNDAVVKSIRADNMIFKEALGHGVSDRSAQFMLANIQKTYADLSRLTLTTATTSEAKFVNQANAAYMQVATGAFDYDTAMENACRNLAKDGVTAIQYRNGTPVQYTIEAAVRMNILTGINQTAATITMNNCEELDCDLVETSAHIGARPEHEDWQGEVFSLSGNNPKYRPFSVCGLGTVTGICGINCRHSFYPYFEGEESHYTEKELDEMAEQTVTYNGQEMTRYEGEQKLRGIERNIRHYKREAMTLEAGGVDNTKARAKLGEWQARARDFTEQTGIQRDRAREFIGTENGKQPKALNPSVIDEKKNIELAHKIKRLDNSTSKKIADTNIGAPMDFQSADGKRPNPNYEKGGGYTTNCQSCVVTYEMRRRGYDVQTLPNVPGSMLEVLSHDTSLAWVDRNTGKPPEYIIPAQKTLKKTVDYLEKTLAPEHRYTIQWSWNGGSGHIIHCFVKNSELHIYDPQTGEHAIKSALLDYIHGAKINTIKLMDVEACDVNLNVVNKIMEKSN
jgi:hypothetical protein